jgi:hypothetical protein
MLLFKQLFESFCTKDKIIIFYFFGRNLELFQEEFLTALVDFNFDLYEVIFQCPHNKNCSRMKLEVIILCYGVACLITKLQFHLTFVGYLQMMFEFMSYSSRIFENCGIVFKRFLLLTL